MVHILLYLSYKICSILSPKFAALGPFILTLGASTIMLLYSDDIGNSLFSPSLVENPARILQKVSDLKIFYDSMHPKYITGSLKRESCKVLIKGFNKEFLPGSLAEHPIHHLVHSDILHRMLGIHAVLLAEIFLGFSGLLLNGRETI